MNGIFETTTTPGTGDLTLVGVAGRPRVSDVLGAGSLASYYLKDANGNKEWGVGKVGTSNTFIRLRPTKTIVGSAVTLVSPSPITLSGGASELYISPISGSHPVAMRRIATNAGRKGLYSPHIVDNVTSTLTAVADRLYVFPFQHNEDMPITGAFIDMNTSGAAGTKARLCLYRMDENFEPTDILAESGDVDTSVAPQVLTAPWTPVDVPPDWLGIGLLCSGGPVLAAFPSGVRTIQSPFGLDGSGSTMLPVIGLYKTIGAGWTSMPASPTGFSKWYHNTAAMPAIGLRFG